MRDFDLHPKPGASSIKDMTDVDFTDSTSQQQQQQQHQLLM